MSDAGQAARDAYAASTGQPVPGWLELSDLERAGWDAAADAAVQALVKQNDATESRR